MIEINNVNIDFNTSTKSSIKVDIDDLARDYISYNYEDYKDVLDLFVDEVLFGDLGVNPETVIKAQDKRNPDHFEILNIPGISINFNLIYEDDTIH